MDIGLIDDMPVVKAYMNQDEIWGSIEDGIEKDDFYPSNDRQSQWLCVVDEGQMIGMILVHNDTNVSIKMHPYMTEKHKGREMMLEFYKWFMELPIHINKLNVSIPVCQRKVINFAKKVGFKQEGINRSSHMKNGIYHDQIEFGLTRSEIEALL